MPYSIAAPIVTSRTLMVRIGADGFHRRAHNDNGSALPEPDAQSDMLLAAALKCLTQHGLRAAQEAHDRAERAFLAGERANCDWWLGVCRMLDRRLANDLCERFEARATR